ncbi:MAG: helix-turn-helix domain-containing protein [Clostridia bacterium]|nr:helix-turn-helix domain-containing protein [Clostridia bacterium]MBQ4098267.1 helix-turn-helix domain-containing protein [Clostridia bacterium]
MNPFISCKYTLGSISTIENNWNWSNVVIPDNKIYVIEKGEIFVEGGGVSFTAREGDMVLIPSNVMHSARLTDIKFVKKSWIHFAMKQGVSEYFSGYTSPVKIKLSNLQGALDIINGVIRHGDLSEPFRSLKTSSMIFELVAIFFDKSLPQKMPSYVDNIDKAIEFINDNYTEQFTLDFLAEKFNCSGNHFIKKFKEKTGYTPIKYLSIKKIEEAKRLLENTDLPINIIMEKVGYLDASYFSKLFKKLVGYSPKNFRDNVDNKVKYE